MCQYGKEIDKIKTYVNIVNKKYINKRTLRRKGGFIPLSMILLGDFREKTTAIIGT